MKVYIIVHDDQWMDVGDTYVRGVFDRRVDAQAALVTRTRFGNVSRAIGSHHKWCCQVQEWDVQAQRLEQSA